MHLFGRPKPGLVSFIFLSGLILLLLSLSIVPKAQADDKTPSPAPQNHNQAEPTQSSGIITSTITPSSLLTTTINLPAATPTSTAGPTATPSPTPTAPQVSASPTVTLTVSPTPTSTVTPGDPSSDEEAKKQKEKEEKEKAKQEALTKARDYNLTTGQPSVDAINNWLMRCDSPQLQEAQPGKTMGQIYIELGWKYGVNPAYAVAFFTKESSCGTAGNNLASHNFGNIRWTPGFPTIDNVWRAYPTWTAGMEDWFKLLKENYINQNLHTVADILPVYAPEFENDTTLYMNQIMQWVDTIMTGAPDSKLDMTNSWYCVATGYRIAGDFYDFWHSHGNVVTMGWPISYPQYEGGRLVQYFDRAVLELHPENPAAYKVMLRNLGRDAGKVQPAVSGEADKKPDAAATFISETGHWLSGYFTQTWKKLGGVAQLGYPIAEPQLQGSSLVQWFERGRLEINLLQNGTDVLLGQVGMEAQAGIVPPNIKARPWAPLI